MKTKTLTAALALTSLLTMGGPAFAAEDPHDAYDRAFAGKTSEKVHGAMGRAAYAIPTDTSPWSGHDAYNQAILGIAPSKPDADTLGKAAYGSHGSSNIDGNAAYQSAFRGD